MKQEILNKSMQLCSRKECCRKEIFEKIISWDCTPAEANELIELLVEQKFIDERRYTEAYVKDKLRFNKWGRIKIGYMLRMQNIDRNTVNDVLSEIDEDEYNKILIDELKKKHNGLRGKVVEVKGKLFRFATSRGFENEIVSKTIFQLVK